jgi:transposase-like protein
MRVKRKQSRAYSREFREECIALIGRDPRTYAQLSRDLGVSSDTLRQWYNKAMAKKGKARAKDVAAGAPAQESTPQRLARLERENARLQRENETLKMDKEILKKAAAFFARENE